MKKTIKYELQYKTKDYQWKLFDTYKSKDDEELIKHHNTYSRSKVIELVRVVEVVTTRTEITI